MTEFLNPEQLEMKVQDKTGEIHIFKLKHMTCDELDEMSTLKMNNEKPGTSIRKQMTMMFGRDDTFYKNFTTTVLTKVLKYVTAEIKNPTQEK